MRNQPYAFIGCEAYYEDASLVVFGAPYDGTTSFRPGTRFGPSAMRAESIGIETYSPYQDSDLLDTRVFDAGDLELPFGSPERVLDMIEDMARRIALGGKTPCMLGGEHLVTLGAVRALAPLYPNLRILHFDAHADLRQDYLGEKLSHACVMRRCWDILGDGRIYQFGIRSGDREEFSWAPGRVSLERFTLDTLPYAIAYMADAPVYLTVDLDVLDPSILPGTGTPEAGGVSFRTLLEALLATRPLNIVGFDLCELSPAHDPSGVSTAVACKLLRELLLARVGR